MTNLITAISTTITTNWITVANIVPVIPPAEAMLAVYRSPIVRQVGQPTSNTVVTVEWKGEKKSLVVESVALGPQLTREIADVPESMKGFLR